MLEMTTKGLSFSHNVRQLKVPWYPVDVLHLFTPNLFLNSCYVQSQYSVSNTFYWNHYLYYTFVANESIYFDINLSSGKNKILYFMKVVDNSLETNNFNSFRWSHTSFDCICLVQYQTILSFLVHQPNNVCSNTSSPVINITKRCISQYSYSTTIICR